MVNQKEWKSEVRAVFDKIKLHEKLYSIDVNGVEVDIFPNVFSPAYFTDSKWFAETVMRIVGNGSLLDVGTGTGIVGLFAALNGSKVSVTDISSNSVENAKHNFEKHGLVVLAYCGNMYEPLKGGEKFDFIFWNHPFNCGNNPDEEMLLKSGFDFNYESLEKYISGANKYLNPGGRLLLGTGNFARLDKVEEIARKYGYEMKLLERVEIPLAADSSIENDYRIYELEHE